MTIPSTVDLTISIVSYRSADVLVRCLQSIFDGTHGIRFDISVVDNASKDGICHLIRRAFPGITVIENATNEGFGKGHNRILERASGRYVFVLNPDCLVLPGTLETLVRFMDDHQDVGVAGCRNWLNEERTFEILGRPTPRLSSALMEFTSFCELFPNSRCARKFWATAASLRVDVPRQVGEVLGSAIFLRREAVRQAGLFDENYFLYYEEYDWYRRIISAGWKVYFVPQAGLIHLAGQSSKKSDPQWIGDISKRSRDYYYRKFYGWAGLEFVKLLGWFNTIAMRGRRRLKLIAAAPRRQKEQPDIVRTPEGLRFGWSRVHDANEYIFEIALDPGFLARAATVLRTNEIVLSWPLLKQLPAPQMFWRVAPVSGDGVWGRFIAAGRFDGLDMQGDTAECSGR